MILKAQIKFSIMTLTMNLHEPTFSLNSTKKFLALTNFIIKLKQLFKFRK